MSKQSENMQKELEKAKKERANQITINAIVMCSIFLNEEKNQTQVDNENMKQMKEVWESLQLQDAKLKILTHKHQATALKDAQILLTKKYPKSALKDSFQNSDLFKQFTQQVQSVLQLNLALTELGKSDGENLSRVDSLNTQVQKLQKDMKDITSQKDSLQKQKDALDSQVGELTKLKSQMQEILNDKIGFKLKLEEQRERVDMLATENQHLKEKVADLEEDNKQQRRTVKSLQNQIKAFGDLQIAMDKAKQDNLWLEQQLALRETDVIQTKQLLSQLQNALSQAQSEGEQSLKAKERELKEIKTQLESLQSTQREARALQEEVTTLRTRVKELTSDLDQVRVLGDKADSERREIKRYAQELVERVKAEAECQRFMIDRRMITQFLLNFMNPKSNAQMKTQMADAMSKILEFTGEERASLGLKPVSSSLVNIGQSVKENSAVNIADKLVSFFLIDDE